MLSLYRSHRATRCYTSLSITSDGCAPCLPPRGWPRRSGPGQHLVAVPVRTETNRPWSPYWQPKDVRRKINDLAPSPLVPLFWSQFTLAHWTGIGPPGTQVASRILEQKSNRMCNLLKRVLNELLRIFVQITRKLQLMALRSNKEQQRI